MHRLMFRWLDSRLMDEAGGNGGEGGGGTGGGQGGTDGGNGGQGGTTQNGGADNNGGGQGGGGTAGGTDGGTDGGQGGTDGGQGGTDGGQGGDKPFLGGKKDEPKKQDGTTQEPKKQDGSQQPPDEKAYLDAIVKDEAVFGKDDNLAFDQGLIKAVIPVCQKHGISTEAANALANAFAKAQLDGARAAYKERCDRFAKMNGEARAKYTDGDFEQINRGIDKWFKPGGVMNNVIRNSELGADPEFLALMHELGAAEREDDGKGAAAGGGDGGTGDANGINGLSKLW